jgi:hypothetical protein
MQIEGEGIAWFRLLGLSWRGSGWRPDRCRNDSMRGCTRLDPQWSFRRRGTPARCCVSRASLAHTAVRNCTRGRGGPSGSAISADPTQATASW